jgi:hypothetical protein
MKGNCQGWAWIFRQNRRRIVDCRNPKNRLNGIELFNFFKERAMGLDNFHLLSLEVRWNIPANFQNFPFMFSKAYMNNGCFLHPWHGGC